MWLFKVESICTVNLRDSSIDNANGAGWGRNVERLNGTIGKTAHTIFPRTRRINGKHQFIVSCSICSMVCNIKAIDNEYCR